MAFYSRTVRFLVLIFMGSGVLAGLGAVDFGHNALFSKGIFCCRASAQSSEHIGDGRQWSTAIMHKEGAPGSVGHSATTDSDELPNLAPIGYNAAADETTEGEPFWVVLGAGNIGSAGAGPSHAKLYLSTDNDADVSDDYYVGEAAGGFTGPWNV